MTVHAPDILHSTRPEQSPWIQKLARAGFAAKGVIYGLIGLFALKTAVGAGGQLGGTKDTVQAVGQGPFGKVLLVLIGAGLLCYALWRIVEAATDARNVGSSGKGLAKRIGYAGSGVVNGAVGVLALQMASGSRGSGGGGEQTYVSGLMAQPFGQVLVALVGIGALAFAVHQIKEGWKREFERKLETSRMSASTHTWATRAGMIGLIARGVIFGIVGVFLIKAALEHQPGEAVGIGGALHTVAAQPLGMILLLLVALGLMGYGVFQLVMAKYGRLPEPG